MALGFRIVYAGIIFSIGVWLGACSAEKQHDIVLQLRTDLQAGEEFDQVQVFVNRLDGRSEGSRLELQVDAEPYIPSARLGEIEGITAGDYRLDVQLRDLGRGRVVAEHPVFVTVDESLALTVPIDRSCLNVVCPPVDNPETSEDESTHIACLGGQCVDPRCTLESPEFCGDLDLCRGDDDCIPEASCATGSVCWVFVGHGQKTVERKVHAKAKLLGAIQTCSASLRVRDRFRELVVMMGCRTEAKLESIAEEVAVHVKTLHFLQSSV